MLVQCPALTHLILSENYCFWGAAETERLGGVLGQCRELVYLNLYHNRIRSVGVSLVGVPTQCPALAHLDVGRNYIGDAGAESLLGVLVQYPALDHLCLYDNQITSVGTE